MIMHHKLFPAGSGAEAFSISRRLLLLSFCLLLFAQCRSGRSVSGPVPDASQDCTPPLSISESWAGEVYPNCFTNLQRLGRWTADTATLNADQSPQANFQPVAAGSINSGSRPIHLYVVTHGWAPGFQAAVQAANSNIQWWSNSATDSDGQWASNWFWTPTSVSASGFEISNTGLIQQIISYEHTQSPLDSVIVLAYSWIDNSATSGTLSGLLDAQYSEAYTNVNGIRLASAIQAAVGPGFLSPGTNNTLHLIGHSHGSKVVTVAAITLQNLGLTVTQLTVLDSPESGVNLEANVRYPLRENAANLLGFYFNYLHIAPPTGTATEGIPGSAPATFVENYISEFGVGMSSSAGSGIDNIVQVALEPDQLFGSEDAEAEVSDEHAYSGTWYAGAAFGAAQQGDAPVGLAWPPFPSVSQPTWLQGWNGGNVSEKNQWQLTNASLSNADFDLYTYATGTAAFTDTTHSGPLSGSFTDSLIFSASFDGTKADNSSYTGKVDLTESGKFGLAFEFNWQNPTVGDYFVVTVEDEEGADEVILCLDGKSIPAAIGWQQLSFNSDYSDFFDTPLNFYFFPGTSNAQDRILIRNFRYIQVSNASE